MGVVNFLKFLVPVFGVDAVFPKAFLEKRLAWIKSEPTPAAAIFGRLAKDAACTTKYGNHPTNFDFGKPGCSVFVPPAKKEPAKVHVFKATEAGGWHQKLQDFHLPAFQGALGLTSFNSIEQAFTLIALKQIMDEAYMDQRLRTGATPFCEIKGADPDAKRNAVETAMQDIRGCEDPNGMNPFKQAAVPRTGGFCQQTSTHWQEDGMGYMALVQLSRLGAKPQFTNWWAEKEFFWHENSQQTWGGGEKGYVTPDGFNYEGYIYMIIRASENDAWTASFAEQTNARRLLKAHFDEYKKMTTMPPCDFAETVQVLLFLSSLTPQAWERNVEKGDTYWIESKLKERKMDISTENPLAPEQAKASPSGTSKSGSRSRSTSRDRKLQS